MHYFGGKSRTAKRIGSILNQFNPHIYYEPFCGGLWVTLQVQAQEYLLSDNNQHLITMYQKLQQGWKPPEFVDETTYQYYRMNQDPNDPMTAFVGIGCAFSGKWFGGYARSKPRGNGKTANYAGEAGRSLLKKMNSLSSLSVAFSYSDFRDVAPADGSLVYCDPPYHGTMLKRYSYTSRIDDFWETMREWSSVCTVIISEYKAPEDFICIEEFPVHLEVRNGSGQREPRVERLFMKL